MERELIITVTEDDIRNGHGGSPDGCPVALAVARAYPPDAGWWSVRPSCISHYNIHRNRIDILWINPREAEIWIANFDNGRPVEPITFTAVLREGD